MGLEWIDTWAGLAGFLGVLAWLGNQNRQLRKYLEERFKTVDQRFRSVDQRFDAVERQIADVRTEVKDSEQRVLAFVNRRIDDLNKRLDDFKDFVLAHVGGAPRRRDLRATESRPEPERRAER